MSNKKYYWLKMHKDFLKTKEVKKLRKISGGDTFTIIYLKMMLLSLETHGVIVYEGIENTFAEELALELDEDAVNVNATLLFLQNTGLISEKNDEHTLNHVEQMIGSETPQAGYNRKRRVVNNQQLTTENVTMLPPVTKPLQQSKRIEIDTELENRDIKQVKKSPVWVNDIEEYKSIITEEVTRYYKSGKAEAFFERYHNNLNVILTLERVSEVFKEDAEYKLAKKRYRTSSTGVLNWTTRIQTAVSWTSCKIYKERK